MKPATLTTAGNATPSTELAEKLRDEIVSGRYAPGDRLPNRTELREHFNSTAATIQRTFDILQRQGFVKPRGRAGSFVVDHPPHLSHYVLVLEHPLKKHRVRNQFWNSLVHELKRMSGKKNDARRFSIFYSPSDTATVAQFEELIDLVRNQQVAGLIFASAPHSMNHSPVLEHPGVPRVVIASGTEVPDAALIQLHGQFARALDILAERGRKRIGILGHPEQVDLNRLDRMLRKRGMQGEPLWQHAVHYSDDPRWQRNLVRLLLEAPRKRRPDGLIIANDNIVEVVTGEIAASNIPVPKDMDVVAHANFPLVTPSRVPAIRVGYDAAAILRAGIGVIDAMRRGEAAPRKIPIEAVLEDELLESS